MNRMEQAAQRHAAEWLAYQRSPQYAADLRADIARRAAIDAARGHTPRCGILQCVPGCTAGVRSFPPTSRGARKGPAGTGRKAR